MLELDIYDLTPMVCHFAK